MKDLPAQCDRCFREAVIVTTEAGSEKPVRLCLECLEKELEEVLQNYTDLM